ncbi:MAG: carbohydrate ABC transporter permease [Clostridia bacterium]|nr:carbohydrate ABC transporter permease [Clostridia bacterium]MBO4885592.1 carbohydrate ABC transporter permease [Clostridia bacterium]
MHKLKRLTAFDVVITALMLLLSLIFIYPLWTIFVAAFSEPLEYVKNPLALFPAHITLYNFRKLITSATVWNGYKNTLIYVSLGTLINVTLTFVTAYAIAMKELPYRRLISFLITLTLFFSGGLIPTYIVVKNYGMLNTVWAMVLPGAIATYNLMITRTYLSQQIPADLTEAAEVDGAGAFRTFIQIVTPLSKPILAVITLFYASGHWNAWTDAMIYLGRSVEMYPLQLILRSMLINEETMGLVATEGGSIVSLYTITLNYAVMVIAILPLLIVFPFVQKFFVKGVMIGAIKG